VKNCDIFDNKRSYKKSCLKCSDNYYLTQDFECVLKADCPTDTMGGFVFTEYYDRVPACVPNVGAVTTNFETPKI